MILTGPEIVQSATDGRVQIEPFTHSQVNPNSYNVRLGGRLERYVGAVLNSNARNEVETIDIPADGYVLKAGELYLGHTAESVGSDVYVPMLFGRSSVGRLGLFVEITAPIGDIGFFGQWTLMLTPVVPIRVYADMQIGQIMFFVSTGDISLYTGKYQGASGPRSSELWRSMDDISSFSYKSKI